MVVDEQLADVVMIHRQEIDTFLQEHRNLASQLENLTNNIEFNKNEERKLLEKRKNEAEEKMAMEI